MWGRGWGGLLVAVMTERRIRRIREEKRKTKQLSFSGARRLVFEGFGERNGRQRERAIEGGKSGGERMVGWRFKGGGGGVQMRSKQ